MAIRSCWSYAAAWLAACLCWPGAEAQTSAPPPVSDFFRVPQVLHPMISPDGRFVAVSVSGPDGRMRLGVINLAEGGEAKVLASFDDADVTSYQWVTASRLVYSADDLQLFDRHFAPGLWAVNVDGSDYRQLINARYGGTPRLGPEWRLHSVLRDGSADVIVVSMVRRLTGEPRDSKLARLDTATGMSRSLVEGTPEHVYGWTLDSQGRLAAVETMDEGRSASYLKTDDGGWKLWQTGNAFTGSLADPFWIGPKGELLALARNGGDTVGVFSVDRATGKLAEQPTVSLPGYDFDGTPIYDDAGERLLGYHYENDAQGTAWLDAGMKTLQAEIDKRLPSTANRIDCENCTSAKSVLVSSVSDRQPPIYYVYQREKQELRVLGTSRPWIKPAQMGQRDVYRFKARDGLSIPVLVTQPPGKASGPKPAVLLAHGGPWIRGNHWAWEREAQFLASRGYVVIEPEFRGSTGYGAKLFHAGWKQWGLAMQDDLVDAVAWAAKQGWVDPKRVCIAGASYGGYATLMGLIRDPDVYQCGVEWVGVSDINLMYSINWSDASAQWKDFGMPALVGDQEKDKQQLKDTSPVEQAGRLKRPLLMAYGALDRRVPIAHGRAFRDAVPKTSPPVEWIVYPDEGHGWHKLETHVDFWTRVEKFLDRQIGPASAKP